MSLAVNKKARFDYDILETFEAGIVLLGHEVKSAKEGNINLKGAYVALIEGEALLYGAHIAPYKKASHIEEYDPYRARKLLLHKKELNKLVQVSSIKGLTIVPLSVYIKGKNIKIEIAIARGKRTHDKRETIKKRDIERELRNEMR